MRLYCFPFVGAPAEMYLPLEAHLPETVELCALELPGHGARSREPLTRDVTALGRTVADVVSRDAAGRPFAFFGHCAGALLAYETACALSAAHLPGPVLLAVSALVPPHRYAPHMAATVCRPTGVNMALVAEMIRDARRCGVAMAAISKAEAVAYSTHTPAYPRPLTCPVTVMGGSDDSVFPPDRLDGWAAHTTAGLKAFRLYPGRHLYLLDHWRQLADDLAEDLDALPHDARPVQF
ncbi:hypothetical protein GCM10018785_11400 [Streptomyces longispororuber]|uniref:Thioesterase TesA-like domain-containing protein n=1 Tax=Streptomyces longispororuber TaxID=68230 RepID=A0A919DFP0_9ACTN|nr:hypothetical protein GCM10018785_11400 [Streptomyces longispororuber]